MNVKRDRQIQNTQKKHQEKKETTRQIHKYKGK